MDIMCINNMLDEVNDSAVRKILEGIVNMMEEITAPAELLFAKVKPDAIIPTKRDEDAGFDMYACIEEDAILIEPHQTLLIPTGIATCFSQKYMFKLSERGSTGTKGIGQRCGVIDSGYRNEIMVPVTNLNDKPMLIVKDNIGSEIKIRTKGGVKNLYTQSDLGEFYEWKDLEENSIIYPMSKAITQGVLVELPKDKTKEIPYDELKDIPSERMMGAWGSSKKSLKKKKRGSCLSFVLAFNYNTIISIISSINH